MELGKDLWLVRAGQGGHLVEDFIKNGIIAIGWNDVGDMANFRSNEYIKKAVKRNYPEYKTGRVNVTAGQLSRFVFDFKRGDYAITYDPEERKYHIGKIVSDYRYDDTLLKDMHHIRDVEWTEKNR